MAKASGREVELLKNRFTRPEAFVSHASHANAALTPKARLRLGRLVVEDGWTVAQAARAFGVSWRTADRWARRYAELGQVMGQAGMADRSSRPQRMPTKTPQHRVKQVV